VRARAGSSGASKAPLPVPIRRTSRTSRVAVALALDGMSKVMYSSASGPVKVPLEEEVRVAFGIVTRMWASDVVDMMVPSELECEMCAMLRV